MPAATMQSQSSGGRVPEVIVFLGPSMPIDEARQIVRARFEAPIRRGDLAKVPGGSVIGMIDGVFGQNLAVDPTEILETLARGVRILGSSSMGALRAAELEPFGIVGVGRIFQMYRDRVIESDEEVALVFDEATFEPLSVPLVNVRYAVERLVRPGTIDANVGRRIVNVAKRLPYVSRTYRLILKEAGLAKGQDTEKLLELLEAHDLKRNDARLLLEQLEAFKRSAPSRPKSATSAPARAEPVPVEPHASEHQTGALRVWEVGGCVTVGELIHFLKLSGRFAEIAERAIFRYALSGGSIDAEVTAEARSVATSVAVERRFRAVLSDWGLFDPEDSALVLRQLGIGLGDLQLTIEEDLAGRAAIGAIARHSHEELTRAIRSDLFITNLELKREVARCSSLRHLANLDRERYPKPLSAGDVAAARRLLAWANDAKNWAVTLSLLGQYDVSSEAAERFAEDLARAGRAAQQTKAGRSPSRARERVGRILRLRDRRKVEGSGRDCVPPQEAERHCRRLGQAIGVTRVGTIGKLSSIGLPVAQAFRPGTLWSSTIGGGKGITERAAKVGAVMEEIEKYGQEHAAEVVCDERVATYRAMKRRGPTIDPATLPLPNDSRYRPDLPVRWAQFADLMGNELVWAPSALFLCERQENDPRYSVMRGDIFFSSNGLASALCLEQAIVHGLCEYVERHTSMLAQLRIANPGLAMPPEFHFIPLDTWPAPMKRLAERCLRGGFEVRALEITGDVAIPTFWVMLFEEIDSSEDGFGRSVRRHDGFCTHPDPGVALRGALLEAVQTVTVNVAGAREDLTVKARSLGRHERPWTRTTQGQRFLLAPQPHTRAFSEVAGFLSRNCLEDLSWCLDRLRSAGVERVLVADYSRRDCTPARVIRVLIPGLESDNPYFVGSRARSALLEDLLPRSSVDRA